MNNIPIVFIHFGYADYFKESLIITSIKNKNIYVIGDDELENINDGLPHIKFINIEKYINTPYISQKIRSYKHNCQSNSTIELICFLRIPIIHLFLMDMGINQSFYLDSDCVLLKNLNEYNFSKDCAYIIPRENHPVATIHSALLDRDICEKYSEIYDNVFVHDIKYNSIEEGKLINNLCDMRLYYVLYLEHKESIQNLGCPNENYVFMDILGANEGDLAKDQYLFDESEKIMKIIKTSGKNFIYDEIRNNHVELFNIHFQGDCKKKIKYRMVF